METQKSKLGLYRIVQTTEYVEKIIWISNATWLKASARACCYSKKSLIKAHSRIQNWPILDEIPIWFPLECSFWLFKLDSIFFKNENPFLSSPRYDNNRMVQSCTTQDQYWVHVSTISEVYLLQTHSRGIRPSGMFQRCSKLFLQFLTGCF